MCNNIFISAVLTNFQSLPNKRLYGPETETRGFQEQDQDYEVQDQDYEVQDQDFDVQDH